MPDSEDLSSHIPSLRQAADCGDAKAQCHLGLIYKEGLGVPKDAQQAAFWLRAAAEQGFAKAQFHLAILYEDGLGVKKDDAQAAAWLLKAAAQGLAQAQGYLGVFYFEGQGVPKDKVQALVWFYRAVAQTPDDGQESRLRRVIRKMEFALPPDSVRQAKELAHEDQDNAPRLVH